MSGAPRHALLVLAVGCELAVMPAAAQAHGEPPTPPAPGAAPARELPPVIPSEDEPSYRSRVTAIPPSLAGLEARMVDGQDLLELRWTRRAPLHVLGYRGEPMFRLSSTGVYVNVASPSTWDMSERFGRSDSPPYATYGAKPRWTKIAGPGVWRWAEHRAQWMRRERPASVGDGSRRTAVFSWSVPLRLRGRDVAIEGVLEWIPDVVSVREQRSSVSSPLLSAAILLSVMALGAGVGVVVRRRLG